jgi:hypothetical protein
MSKYLVQALRSYRLKSYGQFDQVTEHVLDITQDAANEIEQLTARIAELEKPRLISFDGKNARSGMCQGFSWGTVKDILEAKDGKAKVSSLILEDHGLTVVWA